MVNHLWDQNPKVCTIQVFNLETKVEDLRLTTVLNKEFKILKEDVVQVQALMKILRLKFNV